VPLERDCLTQYAHTVTSRAVDEEAIDAERRGACRGIRARHV
jgi:hypothetical protein